MNEKTKNLQNLLKLVKELSSRDDMEWFKNELVVHYSSSTKTTNSVDNKSLINNYEFNDFPSFLRFQKINFRIKGKAFYFNIKEIELKNQLVKDFVEMYWFLNMNNIDRFMLFTYYQFENLLNYYCTKSNCFEKIEKNRNYFIESFGKNFVVICSDNFFYKTQCKPIEKVSIWAKLVFWFKDSNNDEWEGKNHTNISNLINIRNKNAHRQPKYSNEKVINTISLLEKQDFSKFSFYINILSHILKSFESIDNRVVELNKIKNIIRGPKTLGYIDPETLKK